MVEEGCCGIALVIKELWKTRSGRVKVDSRMVWMEGSCGSRRQSKSEKEGLVSSMRRHVSEGRLMRGTEDILDMI